MANENLTDQIVVALLQDGTIKMDTADLTDIIQAVFDDLPPGFAPRFLGVATPGLAPGKILEPTLYVAVAGGRYPSFSNNQVNEGEIHFFVSADGKRWSDILAYAGEGGGGGCCTCVETEMPEDGFKPDVLYNLGTIDEDTTFLMDTDEETDCGPNHYYWTFETPEQGEAPTITWPRGLQFVGTPPDIENFKHYEVSVLGRYAVVIVSDQPVG